MTRRIALVGLSWISSDLPGHAADPTLGTAIPYSHASAVAAIPELELVAGCDISATARDTFRDRWSGRYPGLTVYDDYAEMLRTERPEFVAVVTPDHLHRGVVEVAIEAGARGIFCEKPIATTLEDADAIVAAVQAAGVTMNVNYTRRWFPEFVEARRMVRDGEIGKLSQIVVEMGGPRSMLFRNHTHAIDLVNFLADSEPLWVWSELEPGFEDYGIAYAGDGGNDPATEPGGNYYIAYRQRRPRVPDRVQGHGRARHGRDADRTERPDPGRPRRRPSALGLPRGHPDQARCHDGPADPSTLDARRDAGRAAGRHRLARRGPADIQPARVRPGRPSPSSRPS